jgi:RNA polymerase sigma factor (sigma-70 family)
MCSRVSYADWSPAPDSAILEVPTVARSYESLADKELVELARAGEDAAFAELWRRHADAARRYALSITRSVDSEDIVSEAFAKIFSLIKRGKGPTNGFRSYLVTAIRHTSESFGRTRRETPIDFIDDLADERTDDQHQQRTLDQSLTIAAFKSLPDRWQEALWYSEVEQLSVKEIAALFGIKPTAMAMLTFRAREGLREAWIQVHIADIPPDSEHRWTIEHLGAYARHKLPRVQQQMVEDHLRDCESCSIVAEEARYVGSQLALGLLAPLIGLGAATAYIASAGHGAAAAVTAEVTADATSPRQPTRARAWRSPSRLIAVVSVAAVLAAVIALTSVALSLGSHHAQSNGHAGGKPNEIQHPPHAIGGSSSSVAPDPTPTLDSSGALIAASETGDLHLFFPIVFGRATPGAVVRIMQGSTVLAKVTASAHGKWSTGQLSLEQFSSLIVTSSSDARVERSRVEVSIARPAIHTSSSSVGVTITVTGRANAPFVVSTNAQSIAASTLDGSGRWSSTYPAGAVDGGAILVRYQAGKRFGPFTAG